MSPVPTGPGWRHRTAAGSSLDGPRESAGLARRLRARWRDLRERRHALRVFAETQFRANYRAQALGMLWPIANPTILMIVMTIVFGRIFRTDIPGYPVFLMLGLVPWHFLSHAWLDGTSCFVRHADLIKRAGVPPYLLVVGTVLSHGMTLAFASLSLLPLLAVYPSSFRVSLALLLLPVVLALLVLLVVALTLITAMLDVVYRDVGYVVNSLLLVFFWLTPIVYPLDRVSAPVRRVLLISPATSILSCLRDIVMGGRLPPPTVFACALVETLGLLVVGAIVYRRYERAVPDYV